MSNENNSTLCEDYTNLDVPLYYQYILVHEIGTEYIHKCVASHKLHSKLSNLTSFTGPFEAKKAGQGLRNKAR